MSETLQEALEEHLADVPFEDLQNLKSHGLSSGSGGGGGGKWGGARKDQRDGREKRRANKNRPMEMSSKRPVPRFREVILAPKQVHRDPRFESLCGEYDEARFKQSYGFLYTETLPAEAQKLKKAVKKEREGERKGELKARLAAIENQMRAEERRKQAEVRGREAASAEQGRIKAGKAPFFVSKAKQKRDLLIQKYKELKAAGKLEAFLAKRRQRNAAEEHKRVPLQRRS